MKSVPRGMRLLHSLGLLLAGLVHALCFAADPLPAWSLAPLEILSLAVLAHATFTAPSARSAFLRGWLFGFATYALGVYWIFISLHTYGYMPAPLAAGGVGALAVFLGLYPGLACALARHLQPADMGAISPRARWLHATLTWAGAWMAFEWLRGIILSGFPWLNIGYAHVDSPLAGWAPVLGVYGMALIAAFAAAALGAWLRLRDAARIERGASAAVVLAVLLALAGAGLHQVRWSRPAGAPIAMRLIQGNVEQSQKFDPAQMEHGLLQHMNLATQPPEPGQAAPSVMLLPETILPVFQDQADPKVWQLWLRIAAESRASFIMGLPLHRRDSHGDIYTNGALGFDAQTPLAQLMGGDTAMRYDKRHLVPFGEYVPTGFRWFVDAMSIPLGDFDRGPVRQTPFALAGQHIALNICYENLFGEELLPALLAGPNGEPGATILANISNLGWFGDSWALLQHLNISRLRTLETARPMVSATNTGITASIDERGRVLAQLPTHVAAVLPVSVQGMSGLTPYARWGDKPALALAGLILIAAFARRFRAAKRMRA
jgi:apolipoprotein N-acyltransferase